MKGVTAMANLFTPEQQAILRMNPYTLSVSDRQIKFTVEFKRFLLNELSKPDITQKQAFRNAGYDPDIIGKSRMQGIIKNVRNEAASPKGLHETGISKDKLAQMDLSKKRTDTSIKALQDEVIKLQQEVRFLKKILQLPTGDDKTQ